MMKSRIYHIFDARAKKKGAISFLSILALVILFSACQFDIDQNNWKIPLRKVTIDAYGFDKEGNRNSEMMDSSVSLSYDLNGDGKNETEFLLHVTEQGENCWLEYKNDEGKSAQTNIFKDIDPGIVYGMEAANLEDQNSIFILASIDYHGMPLGAGYWELYKWEDGAFEQVDLKPVLENLQMKILTSEEVKNNALKAGVSAYLFDSEKYPVDYPVAALYFKDELRNGTLGSVDYASMSDYDVEGFANWGQDAISKIMSSMYIVSSSDLEGYEGPAGNLLATEEYVFITLPNITATVKQYYQYKDGTWNKVYGTIE